MQVSTELLRIEAGVPFGMPADRTCVLRAANKKAARSAGRVEDKDAYNFAAHITWHHSRDLVYDRSDPQAGLQGVSLAGELYPGMALSLTHPYIRFRVAGAPEQVRDAGEGRRDADSAAPHEVFAAAQRKGRGQDKKDEADYADLEQAVELAPPKAEGREVELVEYEDQNGKIVIEGGSRGIARRVLAEVAGSMRRVRDETKEEILQEIREKARQQADWDGTIDRHFKHKSFQLAQAVEENQKDLQLMQDGRTVEDVPPPPPRRRMAVEPGRDLVLHEEPLLVEAKELVVDKDGQPAGVKSRRIRAAAISGGRQGAEHEWTPAEKKRLASTGVSGFWEPSEEKYSPFIKR